MNTENREAIYWLVFYTIAGIVALYNIYLDLLEENKHGNINKNARNINAMPKNIQPRYKVAVRCIADYNQRYKSNHSTSEDNSKENTPFHWRVVYNKLKGKSTKREPNQCMLYVDKTNN